LLERSTESYSAYWTLLTIHRPTKRSARSSPNNRTELSREPEHEIRRLEMGAALARARLRRSFPLASAALTATDATITHRVRLHYVLIGTPIA